MICAFPVPGDAGTDPPRRPPPSVSQSDTDIYTVGDIYYIHIFACHRSSDLVFTLERLGCDYRRPIMVVVVVFIPVGTRQIPIVSRGSLQEPMGTPRQHVGCPKRTHGIPRYTVGDPNRSRGIPRQDHGVPPYAVGSRGNSHEVRCGVPRECTWHPMGPHHTSWGMIAISQEGACPE